MENISPLGWAAVACVGMMFMVLNVGLIALLRTKPRLAMKAPLEKNVPRPDQVLAVMRDPFGQERKQIDELSGLMGQLGEAKEQEKDR